MKEYRGLGGTYKRNKIWWIHYSARGVVYRETSKSPEEKDAIKLLKTRIGDIANGKTLGSKAERVTLKDLVEALRNDYERMRRRSTRLIDRVEHHLIAHFGENARAIDIKEAKILEYEKARKSQLVNHTVKYVETHKSQLFENDKTYSEALKMQHKGRMMVAPSDSTVSGELRLLRYAFNIMVDARRLSHDDVPKFPVLVESPARQGFIDPPEFKRLLDALPDDLKDPVAFQYHSGWRKNEMQTLDWSDVDIANGTIRLRPEHSKNGHARPLKLRGEMLAIIKRAADRRDPAITFVFHRDGQPIGDFRKAWKKHARQRDSAQCWFTTCAEVQFGT